MDGFTDSERVLALKRSLAKLQVDLEIFKQEEIDAFKIVQRLDDELQIKRTAQLEERRRQKFVFASGLKWNILYQEKEINLCKEAIAREESQLVNSSIVDSSNMSRDV